MLGTPVPPAVSYHSETEEFAAAFGQTTSFGNAMCPMMPMDSHVFSSESVGLGVANESMVTTFAKDYSP